MAEEKQLGIFWGNKSLYFVETVGTDPKKAFQIPIAEENREAVKGGHLSPAGTDLISNIQNILRKEKITASKVNLSLPAKEIIFRSFVVPWMQQHEIKSVVEFEASKYIPFSLEELSFSFHPITIEENNVKRIRIIFVAIRKDVLKNYVKILEETSLRVDAIEPAASSLIRALNFKNLIPKDKTVALIERGETGRIIVVDNEIPQFVREFHLSTASGDQTGEDPEADLKNLTREVRISLDYFKRQNEQLQIAQILLLTSSDLAEFPQDLEKNLDAPITLINDQAILGDLARKEIGFLNAYGTCIIPLMDSAPHFNLSHVRSKSSKPTEPLSKKPIDYKSLIKTSLVCIPIMIISIITSGFLAQKFEQEISVLNQKLGSFQDADISMIKQRESGLITTLAYFKNTRMQSDSALFLLLVPDLLPNGVWIENLDITYDDSEAFTIADTAKKMKKTKTREAKTKPNLIITLDGHAYSRNKNEQFRLVNRLLKNLKNSKEFSSFFPDIDLETTRAQKLDEHSVTSFKILCKQSYEPKRPKQH